MMAETGTETPSGAGTENKIVPTPGYDLGSGGEGNNGSGVNEVDGDASPSLQALRWFYRHLHLSEADWQMLWEKRGLTPATCLALGFRSNPLSNKELLLQMADLFPPQVLVDCGLWSDPRKPGDKPAPNAQFYGMSLVEMMRRIVLGIWWRRRGGR